MIPGLDIWRSEYIAALVVRSFSVFERRILRKVFVLNKAHNGTWRTKTNSELDELIKHRNIINYVKT
jgi:hypothetical protein